MPRLVAVFAAALALAPVTGTRAAPPEGCCVLTASDSGDLFRVARGQRIEVRLDGSPQTAWSAPEATNAALARVALTRRGGYVVATFIAEHRGTTAIRAVRRCSRTKASCVAPSRIFYVHLVIR